MIDQQYEIELPVRLTSGVELEALAREIIGACNDNRKFVFWSEDWVVQGDQVYRAQFALPSAISKAEIVVGLDAVIVTVRLTDEEHASVGVKRNADLTNMTEGFRLLVERLNARLAQAGLT